MTETWPERGACKDLERRDPGLREAFYAECALDRKPAKKLCDSCPVRLECLSAALERGEIWGVWGGCDEVDLRRALWLDTNGTERERLRFPRCPACRARSEHLFVRSACPIGGGLDEAVECGECGFSWAAASSVAAVRLLWDKLEQRAATVVPMRRPARVRVPRGKIPSGRPARTGRVVQLPIPESCPGEAVPSLVASGAPVVS